MNVILNRAITGLSLTAAGLLVCLSLVSLGAVNRWSLQHWWSLNSRSAPLALTAPPAGHLRAGLWYAAQAIEQNDADATLAALDFSAAPSWLVQRAAGYALLLQGKSAEALALWQTLGDVRSLLGFASTAEREEEMDLAFQALRAAQVLSPERHTGTLVDFLRRQNAAGEAAAVLEAAIEAHPSGPNLRGWQRELADLLVQMGEVERAAAIYAELTQSPVDALAGYIGLGWVAYEQQRNVDAALEYMDRAIAAAPERSEGYQQKAVLLGREERFAEADPLYALAVARNPASAGLAVAYANNARNAGDLAIAVERYLAAIGRFPNHERAYYELAWAYHLQDDGPAAERAIARALALAAEPDTDLLARAGQIAEAAGESDLAAERYRRALALQPNNQVAARGLQRVGTDAAQRSDRSD